MRLLFSRADATLARINRYFVITIVIVEEDFFRRPLRMYFVLDDWSRVVNLHGDRLRDLE